MLLCSLRENYGRVLSLKLGSYKFVMASTPEAVKEMLVKKSADYAGRQQTYSIEVGTLGRLVVSDFRVGFFYQGSQVPFCSRYNHIFCT